MIISIMMQKGGIGKSTTTASLGFNLDSLGKSVLLIDADPQGNLTTICGIDYDNVKVTLADVWAGRSSIQEALQPVPTTGMDLLTVGLEGTSSDSVYAGRIGREKLLAESLEPIKGNYDHILIDTPPALSLLSMNAAAAADTIIIPMGCDRLSVQGLNQLWGFIRDIKRYCNPSLTVSGIVLTMYNPANITTKAFEQAIIDAAAKAGSKVYNSRIRVAQAIKTAQGAGDITIYDKSSVTAIADYMSLTDEILEDIEGDEA